MRALAVRVMVRVMVRVTVLVTAVSMVMLAVLVPMTALAQITFERTYGGPGTDRAYSLDQTGDGGYIIAGSTRSFGVWRGLGRCLPDQDG